MEEIVKKNNKNSTTIMKTEHSDSVSIENIKHDENNNNNISKKTDNVQTKKQNKTKNEKKQKKQKKTKKKKTNRCAFCHDGSKCKKKLSLVDLSIKCRCGKCFCSSHRSMANHFCASLDATSAEKKALLDKHLGGGKFIQINKI
tara:strand:+ start:39 stop:470 length:432 start_codon:yes stop_codon:yes gene_type:complete